jgi:hypothetical protein
VSSSSRLISNRHGCSHYTLPPRSGRPVLGYADISFTLRTRAHIPPSGSWSVARARSRALYRDWFRAAPEICTLYSLNISPAVIRAKIRQEFERTRWVDDLEAMDILLHKGHVEYQETLNAWKMESHVMRYVSYR